MSFVTELMKRISTPKRVPIDFESLVPFVPFRTGIQHHIFQTCKDKKTLSVPLKENIEHIQEMNPDWEYSLFDDADIEEYIRSYYGDQMLELYHRIDSHYGAAKADFFRYLVIYREGGVYLDIKSTCDKPLSSVFLDNDAYLLSFWNNLPGQGHESFGHYPGLPEEIERGEIIQWYIAAAAGHPLLRKVILQMIFNITHYDPYTNGVGWTGTVTTTGPVMYTVCIWNALKESPDQYPVRWTDIIESEGFRYSIFAKQEEKPTQPAHTSHLPTDYRKAITPVIRNKSNLINAINRFYLKLLHATH
jgi:hypothetical protein